MSVIQDNTISLNKLKPNEYCKIVDFKGNSEFIQKLSFKGLFKAKIVRMISSHGSVVIEIDRNITFIGCEIAQKIIVKKIN